MGYRKSRKGRAMGRAVIHKNNQAITECYSDHALAGEAVSSTWIAATLRVSQ
jgi:hypothetical protein